MDYCTNNRNRVVHRTFVVCCKLCHREFPAGVEAYPRESIAVKCPLCGEERRYRIGEVYLGTPHMLVTRMCR